MCGLVGLISSWDSGFFPKDSSTFQELLYIDALRGFDATGVCVINTLSGATVLKEASSSSRFLVTEEWKKIEKTLTSSAKAVLGHNRKSTVGGNDDQHAHPFCFEDRYVFFHNGTLLNHKAIANTDVDSEALGGLLTSCEGDVNKLSDALVKVSGAYACVWYDADKNTIYFLRNNERPLNIVQTESGDFLYASELWMLQACIARNGGKIKTTFSVDPGKLYTLILTKNKKPELLVQEIPKKQKKPQAHSSSLGYAAGNSDYYEFSKREARKVVADLERTDYHSFIVDEVVCASVEEPEPDQSYDWLVMGYDRMYPGVTFKCLLEDKFEHETLKLYNKMAHGKSLGVYYDPVNKTISVTTRDTKFVEMVSTCH